MVKNVNQQRGAKTQLSAPTSSLSSSRGSAILCVQRYFSLLSKLLSPQQEPLGGKRSGRAVFHKYDTCLLLASVAGCLQVLPAGWKSHVSGNARHYPHQAEQILHHEQIIQGIQTLSCWVNPFPRHPSPAFTVEPGKPPHAASSHNIIALTATGGW